MATGSVQGRASTVCNPGSGRLGMGGHQIVTDDEGGRIPKVMTDDDCIRKMTTAEGRMTKLAGRMGQRGFADGEGSPHALIPCMPSLWTETTTCAGAGRRHGRPPHSDDYVCWRALTTVLGSSEAWAVTAPLHASTRPLPWR